MTAKDQLEALTQARVLADIDRFFALSMADLGACPDVALAAAAVSAMHRAGHTCLPLAAAGTPLADIVEAPASHDTQPIPDDVRAIRLPARAAWREALTASGVVACTDAVDLQRPLVLDRDRLYLHRLFTAESRLAARLRELAADATPHSPAGSLARVFGTAPSPETAAAATAAIERRLCIVTGGPGTGKTTLAASLIAMLADLGLARASRIGLATPTGKAAARLQEAVRAQLDERDLRTKVPALAEFMPEASTIHRLLTRSGLRLDALVVDECSMVDLQLMNRLVDALPDACRLILLGDAEQLSSVEPGSVFSDLGSAGVGSPLAPCVVRLTQSHRFDSHRGIGRLASAVVRGDAKATLATLRDAGGAETELRPLPGPAAFEAFAKACAGDWQEHIAALGHPPTDVGAFPSRRVLCAHRRGPFGVNRFNSLVERELRKLGLVEDDRFYVGRPIIVTRNDRPTGLSNGDTGVVVGDAEDHRQVWFPDLDRPGQRFLVSPSRLPEHESFFALTVHRAQGSEYDEVVFIPGEAESRVSTKALFYTAVTRARHKVTVLADEAAVSAALSRTTTRATGLSDRLGARATPPHS